MEGVEEIYRPRGGNTSRVWRFAKDFRSGFLGKKSGERSWRLARPGKIDPLPG